MSTPYLSTRINYKPVTLMVNIIIYERDMTLVVCVKDNNNNNNTSSMVEHDIIRTII